MDKTDNQNHAESPQIAFRVSLYENRVIQKLRKDNHLTIREIIEYLSCPCDRCKNTPIIAFDKISGEPFEIPRGIFNKKIK